MVFGDSKWAFGDSKWAFGLRKSAYESSNAHLISPNRHSAIFTTRRLFVKPSIPACSGGSPESSWSSGMRKKLWTELPHRTPSERRDSVPFFKVGHPVFPQPGVRLRNQTYLRARGDLWRCTNMAAGHRKCAVGFVTGALSERRDAVPPHNPPHPESAQNARFGVKNGKPIC